MVTNPMFTNPVFANQAGPPTVFVRPMATPVDVLPAAPDGAIAAPAVTTPMVSITHNIVTRMPASLAVREAVKQSAS